MNSKKKGNRPGIRRVGRTCAFQVLYGQSFVKAPDTEALKKAILFNPAVVDQESASAIEFAEDLVLGVVSNRESIDAVIDEHSQHWKLSRIAKVELAILRLCLFEMMYTDIPHKAAINEGIELAKSFGDENSKNFINGILDAAARGLGK
jgi:N utilization substance protein B